MRGPSPRRGRQCAIGLAWAVLALVTACDQPVQIGQACDLSSDCPEPYVCRFARCRIACRESRDCGPGNRCVTGDEGLLVCTVDDERSCATDGDCRGALRCAAGECRTECTSDEQCAGERCELSSGTCIDVPSGQDGGPPSLPDGGSPDCTPAPMVCGDRVVQGCETPERTRLLRAILGHDRGELAPLAAHTFGATARPTEDGVVVPPQIAIAGSATGATPGHGVVAWIDGAAGGEQRTLALRRFPLDDLAAAADPGLPEISGVRSVALGEDGPMVRGWALSTPPAVGGGLSAHVLEIPGTDRPSVRSLSAGSPPSDGRGRLAVAGGRSAMLASDHPFFYVNREDPPVGTSLILGATDTALSVETYRVVTTDALSAAPYLDVAGSPGRIVVAREPGTTGAIGVWHIGRTDPTEPIGGIEIVGGIDASDVQGPPSVAPADDEGVEHVIAFPHRTAAGRGEVRFQRISCPQFVDCSAAAELASVTVSSSAPPERVALARIRSGYAYATLQPVARDGSTVVELRWLDENGAVVPAYDGAGAGEPILGALPRASQRVVDVQIAAVRGPDAVTVVVAALIRDDARAEDAVWIGGLRACESF
ncbi:MAG: hypothetical protein M3Y87_16490 [Myxococcota bacterium]|nr:hypothetical protein [Myxococcota bacterium]